MPYFILWDEICGSVSGSRLKVWHNHKTENQQIRCRVSTYPKSQGARTQPAPPALPAAPCTRRSRPAPRRRRPRVAPCLLRRCAAGPELQSADKVRVWFGLEKAWLRMPHWGGPRWPGGLHIEAGRGRRTAQFPSEVTHRSVRRFFDPTPSREPDSVVGSKVPGTGKNRCRILLLVSYVFLKTISNTAKILIELSYTIKTEFRES
jgi:hypothetical protein